MQEELYHYSDETQRKLDMLGFKLSPYQLNWGAKAPERQEAIFVRKIHMAWITSLPVGLCLGFWLMTVKGGLSNALLFWAFTGIVALLRILYVIRGQGREKEGYILAKRDIFKALSKGNSLAMGAEVYRDAWGTSAWPPYDRELCDEKDRAIADYCLLTYLGRTSGQGFDIKRNENFDIQASESYILEVKKREESIKSKIRLLEMDIKDPYPYPDIEDRIKKWKREKEDWEKQLEEVKKEKEAIGP